LNSTPGSKAKVRILVVEDESSVREAIFKILKNYGHEVVTAADGPSALKHFEENSFDMVMTDLSLPGPSGWEVAKAIRKSSPKTPVVLLSGWDINPGDKEMQESGVDRLLTKPVKVKDLLAVINELVPKDAEG
jgi:CheY-like chemotaxis protein